MEDDPRALAIADLARHFEYDTKATAAFYDHHAADIPKDQDHASFLLDRVGEWRSKDTAAGFSQSASGGTRDEFDLDSMTKSIEDLNKAINEMNLAPTESRYSTAATEGLGSALKKGASWVKKKVTGKSSKSSKSSSSKKDKGKHKDEEEEDDDTSDAAIERHQRNLDAMKRTLEKSKMKRRNDQYDQRAYADRGSKMGHRMAYPVQSSPGDSGDEGATMADRAGMHTRGKMSGKNTAERDDHWKRAMNDVDEEAVAKDIERILSNKTGAERGKTKFTMPRASGYSDRIAAGAGDEWEVVEGEIPDLDDADFRDLSGHSGGVAWEGGETGEAEISQFSTQNTDLKFGPFGSNKPALMLEVMAFDHADVVEEEESATGRTVETIVPALASSLELWDRRIDKKGNFAMDRYKFVTDFVAAESLGFKVPGYKAPLLQRIGEFNIGGGVVSTSEGGLFSSNSSKLHGARVQVYQMTLRPDKQTTGLGSKRMCLMHWPLQKGLPVYNSGFVKEVVIKISDVKSTDTQGLMPKFPLEKKTIHMRFSADCKRIVAEDPSMSHLLIDGYVDKIANRAIAILLPYVNKEIKSINFFWEN